MPNAQIMIVEDESVSAKRLQRSVEKMGYGVVSISSSGEQAIRRLESIPPDLIIVDIMLQGEMDGIDVIKRISSKYYIPAIYLTSLRDEHIFERAKETDPVGFILKPFEEDELRRVIALGLYRYRKANRLVREHRRIVKPPLMADYDIDNIVRKRVRLMLQEERRKQKTLWGIVTLLVSVVERKDPYASQHQEETCILSGYIAEEMGLEKEQIDVVCMAAILHDVGKVNMADGLLKREGIFSDKEMELMRAHPQLGYDLLSKLELPERVPEIVLQHHEKINGSGYPTGLSGDNIMIEARIIAVADAIEAMTSVRSYRRAYSLDEAFDELYKESGTLYDPKVVDACRRVFFET